MSKNNKSLPKCKTGEILRDGYHRKAYHRDTYERNGTIIPASDVSSSYVEPTCVKDMGAPGKGLKTLPSMRDTIRLTNYGYGIKKSEEKRRAALISAAKDYDMLEILRKLNLIRNYQSIPAIKQIFTRDVNFLKNKYQEEKNKMSKTVSKHKATPSSNSKYSQKTKYKSKSNSRSNSRSNSKSRSKMIGGISIEQILQNLSLDENNEDEPSASPSISPASPSASISPASPSPLHNKILSSKSIFNKSCTNGKCKIQTNIYEKHTINDLKFEYYILDKNDIPQIIKLNKLCSTTLNVQNKLIDILENKNEFLSIVGMKVDDELQAYCQYKIVGDSVHINYFCALKGYGTPLYTFVEKYFDMNGFNEIISMVNVKEIMADQKINFWYKQGFHTMKIYNEKFLLLQKIL